MIKTIPIGAKPYYNIDPTSKGMTVADTVIDGFIDEGGNVTRRAGLDLFANTGDARPGRGLYFWEQLNKMVIVCAGKCYLMASNGALTDISGSVTFRDANIVFAAGNKVDGSPWLYIADGGYPIYTTGGNCVRLTAASGSPGSVSHVAWLSSRFLILESNSRKVYATDTDPNTGEIENDYFLAADNPLTAEVLPDNIMAIYTDWDEAYFWGSQGLEVWRDDSNFFSPIDGAFAPVGLLAPYSIARADNTVFALATVDNGTKRAVVKMNGRTPSVVSLPIEKIINAYTTVDDAIGWVTATSEYVITFPTRGITWAYNYVTDTWNQWSRWNASFATREEYLGRFAAAAWGKLFTLSRLDGKVYVASREAFTDYGTTIKTEYVSGWLDHGFPYNKRNLALCFKLKCGSTGSYTDAPQVMVKWRDDGALEWRKEKLVSLGTAGQREFTKILFNLGFYRSRQYSFSMTDDTDMVISGISEDVEVTSA